MSYNFFSRILLPLAETRDRYSERVGVFSSIGPKVAQEEPEEKKDCSSIRSGVLLCLLMVTSSFLYCSTGNTTMTELTTYSPTSPGRWNPENCIFDLLYFCCFECCVAISQSDSRTLGTEKHHLFAGEKIAPHTPSVTTGSSSKVLFCYCMQDLEIHWL